MPVSRGALKRYREKIIDIEIGFYPSTSTCFKIASGGSHSDLLGIFENLCTNNIRVIKKSIWMVDACLRLAGDSILEEELKSHFIKNVCILSAIYYAYGEKVDISKSGKYSILTKYYKADKKDVSELDKLLISTGYISLDIDCLICDYIKTGFIDESYFRSEINKLDKLKAKSRASREFGRIISNYGENFKKPSKAIINELNTFVEENFKLIKLAELKYAFEILGSLDKSFPVAEKTSEYVGMVLDSLSKEELKELYQRPENEQFSKEILDRIKRFLNKGSIEDIFEAIHTGIKGKSDLSYLDAYSEDDLLQWIESSQRPDIVQELRDVMKALLHWKEEDTACGSVYKKLEQALGKISEKDAANKIRVARILDV